jgi:hypothetical protein
VRASQQEQTSGVGVSDVSANLERINWGPVPNAQHDLGTDLFVQARDARRFDRGLPVGVQVKAGPSYFEEPARAEDGSLLGWWYYEEHADHFDDWVTHGLPHLLVLHDLDTRVSYWVHVTATAVESTGKGAKILVPAGQRIDQDHLDALLAVAASHKPVIGLQGSAWAASARNLPPARRLRHALLVPRLVAPHPNTGFGTVIGPEEAVALLAQGRVRRFEAFADRHDAVPGLEAAGSSNDWRWRFVAALGRLFTQGDRNAVAATITDAPNPAGRAAACVVTACALMDAERHADAVVVLSEQTDAAHPVDWAWILTQRARARAEIGEVAPARQDAAAALRALVGDRDDLTASAIGAAAAELLFQTAPWGEAPLDELITANDTAVSWWRTQTLSSGFRAAADRSFRQWADDRASRIDFEDTVNDRLFAALVSADLTGEQGTWRAIGSLLARDTLMVQHARGDASRLTDALDELRRSGDDKSLALAARRLWAVGPLGSLAAAARRVQPGSWSHTTARANLALWQHAGDVLDEATASDAARYCLDVVTDDAAFVSRTTPSFRVVPSTLDALGGLLGAADDAFHRDLARIIAGLPSVTDQLEARGWARVAAGLRATVLATAEDHAAWRQAAASQPDRRLAAAILGLLTDHDEAARELLAIRIAAGDNDALAVLGDVGQLDPEVAECLMSEDAELLDATIAQAREGVHPIWTRDPAARLTILGVHFPEGARWDALLGYLGHAHVPGDRKRTACLALARHADRLPEPVRAGLHDLAPQLQATVPAVNLLSLPFGGAGILLAAAVGALDDQTLATGLAGLLTGSHQERRDAAALIGRLGRPEFTGALVALVRDPHPEVRGEAACALAMRVADADTGADPLATAGLQRALADPGARTALAVAAGLSALGAPSDQACGLIAPLLGHASARVRETAARAVGGQERDSQPSELAGADQHAGQVQERGQDVAAALVADRQPPVASNQASDA